MFARTRALKIDHRAGEAFASKSADSVSPGAGTGLPAAHGRAALPFDLDPTVFDAAGERSGSITRVLFMINPWGFSGLPHFPGNNGYQKPARRVHVRQRLSTNVDGVAAGAGSARRARISGPSASRHRLPSGARPALPHRA